MKWVYFVTISLALFFAAGCGSKPSPSKPSGAPSPKAAVPAEVAPETQQSPQPQQSPQQPQQPPPTEQLTGRDGMEVPHFGIVFDPVGDTSFTVSGDDIQFSIPPGVRDLSYLHKDFDSPRVLEPRSGDFVIEVSVDVTLNPGSKRPENFSTLPFQGAGILIWESPENYLRFECDQWSNNDGTSGSYGPLIEYWRKGKRSLVKGRKKISGGLAQGARMRVTRDGKQLVFEVVPNGETEWQKVGEASTTFSDVVEVGVNVINISTLGMEVAFKDFQFTPSPPSEE